MVYFVGVSEENVFRVMSVCDDSRKISNEPKWYTVNSLELKGIRNLTVIKSRYLIIET